MEPKAPEVRQIILLPTDSKEFVGDFDLSYEGNMLFEIEAKIEPQKVVNVFSKVRISLMICKFTLCRLGLQHFNDSSCVAEKAERKSSILLETYSVRPKLVLFCRRSLHRCSY